MIYHEIIIEPKFENVDSFDLQPHDQSKSDIY